MILSKKCTYLFLLLFAITSCANNENNSAVTKTNSEEEELKNAIAKYPDSALLKMSLIQYYEDHNNFDNALGELNNLIRTDSANVDYWDKKAQLLLLEKDTLGTIACLEKAVEIYPEPAYIISLGISYAEMKNKKALEVADALLIGKKSNADKEALFIKGLYFSNTNDYNRAISFFNDAIKLDYTYLDAYLEKGSALYNLNKYEDAAKVFDKAVEVQNNYPQGYYWLGKCFEKMNKTEAAIESYKTALAYDKDYDDAKDALSKMGIK